MARCTLNVWDITPHSIDDLFVNWSKAGGNIHNLLLLTAASALCWTIWITRNEVVFDKCRPKTFLQVLFRGTHWLRQWARLQRHDDLRDQLTLAGQHLETSALHFLVPMGGCHLGLLVYSSQDLLHALLSSSLVVDSFWFLCIGCRPKLFNNWPDSTLV